MRAQRNRQGKQRRPGGSCKKHFSLKAIHLQSLFDVIKCRAGGRRVQHRGDRFDAMHNLSQSMLHSSCGSDYSHTRIASHLYSENHLTVKAHF
jgi:hypothetical protein